MRGTIYKRGKTWTCVFDEQPDEHGRRRQRSRGGFATRKEAQRFLTDTLARLDRGTYSAPSKLSVAEFLDSEWLPAIEATVRPLTVEKYRQAVRLYLKPQIGSQRLQGLSPAHLNAMYGELERAGLSVSTRRQAHVVIGRALRDAERWGRVPRNVARMADPPSPGTSRATSWTAGELRRFLDQVQGGRLFALWRLAATTGMRRGELAGLTWRALDLDGARLSVEQQLVPTRGGASFGRPSQAGAVAPSRWTRRRSSRFGSTRARRSSSGTSPGRRMSTVTSCSRPGSADRSIRSGSRSSFASTVRRRGSRSAACTSRGTPARRWR